MRRCRRRAAVGDMICIIIGLVCLFAVMVVGMDMYRQINLAVKKARIERTYIAAMESEGYLTPAKQNALIDELTQLGVRNISLAGTTVSAVGYGNLVVLAVSGIIDTDGITGITDKWQIMRGGSYEFKIHQSSTAKY